MKDLTLDEAVDIIEASGIDMESLTRVLSSKLSALGTAEEDGPEEYDDQEFEKILADRKTLAAMDKTSRETLLRWNDLEALQQHYADFTDFLYDCVTELLGFRCTDVQLDIGEFISDDSRDRIMIQAQRGEAKSTIAAIYSVWTLIHNPAKRVLIVSAGSDVATEIANWIIQIIMNWDILACLRPDRQHGDRASTKAFDIHWQLKGPEKSPSVACIGITANKQGRRADLLLADDIESSKNGMTELQRAALIHLSLDFTSICPTGRIVYLGTQQTSDSIYNGLEARGYTIRVWPGRYPTEAEESYYGARLSPLIRERMLADPSLRGGGGVDGSRGKPTDPDLLGESVLTAKELDQGPAYFNLQHMLNTSLADQDRFPLRTRDLIILRFGMDKGPGEILWQPSEKNRISTKGYLKEHDLYGPHSTSDRMFPYEGVHMYVDPAGGGSESRDETVAAVSYFLHGYVFLAGILAIPGGYSEDGLRALSKFALLHKPNVIQVEENYGKGAFAALWRPVLADVFKKGGSERCPAIEDVWESGQKELRIADSLEPVIARHRLIVHQDILEYDQTSTAHYPYNHRESYKLIHQLASLTRTKNCLLHDDRIDAVHGTVKFWTNQIDVDETIRMAQKETNENLAFLAEWDPDFLGNTEILGHASWCLSKHNQRYRKSA